MQSLIICQEWKKNLQNLQTHEDIFFHHSLRTSLSFVSYIVKVFKIVSNEVSNILQRTLLLTKCLRILSYEQWWDKAALGNIVKHIPGIFWPAVGDHGAMEKGKFSSPEIHVTTVSTQNFLGTSGGRSSELWESQADLINNSAGMCSTNWKEEDIPCRRCYWEAAPTSQKWFFLKVMNSSSSCKVTSFGLLILVLNTGFHLEKTYSTTGLDPIPNI